MKFDKDNAPVYLTVTLAFGMVLGSLLFGHREQPAMFLQQRGISKTEAVRQLIESYYFEPVDADSLTDEMIAAFLDRLDPHSSYIPARDAQNYNSVLLGEFEGIGITFNILNDTITVISVIPGGPSQKKGLAVGDRIVRIDGENVAGVKIQNTDVIRKLRGPEGTTVRIEVVNPVMNNPLEIEIVRGKIPIHSIDAAYIIAPQTGYVRIQNFSATTGVEFSAALQKLKAQGMRKLVLDLRGNAGGSLQTAVAVCDELLPARQLIVSTRGKSTGTQNYRASFMGGFQDDNQSVVVLIDEWSASASEIVAGAVQDQDRGIIIGRRSFGKGLVQRSFTLSDSSEILLTVARYYTPSGRCIQKPFSQYEEDIVNRYLRGEMQSSDSIPVADSLKYKTAKGRTVYGGGGIIPDIFVPIDTSADYVLFNNLSQAGILFQYSLEYTDVHRIELQHFQDVRSFERGFAVTDAMADEMIRRGKEKGVVTGAVTPGARRELKKWCKAYIARNLYDEEGFLILVNGDDKIVRKALQVLQEK